LYLYNVPWRRYEDPWSFVCETMWSLTSAPANRISGPKKFRSSAEKDFFNTIAQSGFSREYQLQLSAKGRYRFPMVILQYRGPNYGCNAFPPW
jgi:hypothetical protein